MEAMCEFCPETLISVTDIRPGSNGQGNWVNTFLKLGHKSHTSSEPERQPAGELLANK